MKKGLIMGIVGLGSLFTIVEGVKAETLDLTNVSSTGQVVTVGDVDAPVYSVDITWGDLSYDYKYDQNTHEYYWQSAIICAELRDDEYDYYRTAYDNGTLDFYVDENCEKELKSGLFDFDAAVSHGVHYSAENVDGAGTIGITDNSTNARIVPSIKWTPEDNYKFVDGKFEYEGRIGDGTGWIEFDDSATSILPETARNEGAAGVGDTSGWYYLKLTLVNDSTKETEMPVKGDKIGTVTISIDAE